MDDLVDWMVEHGTSLRFYPKGMNAMVSISSRKGIENNTTYHSIGWEQDIFPAIMAHREMVEGGGLGG